ncbi:MAG: hypothetical protein IMZ52_02175, partial [Actinobacteria bacterium]|nr:hypothetical protein [Actinomycetota bacterium]
MVINNQTPPQGQQSSTPPQQVQSGGRKLSMGCIGGAIAVVIVLILIIIAVSVIFVPRNTMVTKELEVDKTWA